MFIFDPKIGMPRDWDLFSFALIPAALGLMNYYAERNDRENYFRYLAIAARGGEAPPAALRTLAEHYLRKGQNGRAREVLREAMSKGLDTTYIESLKVRFPDLRLESYR